MKGVLSMTKLPHEEELRNDPPPPCYMWMERDELVIILNGRKIARCVDSNTSQAKTWVCKPGYQVFDSADMTAVTVEYHGKWVGRAPNDPVEVHARQAAACGNLKILSLHEVELALRTGSPLDPDHYVAWPVPDDGFCMSIGSYLERIEFDKKLAEWHRRPL
jgi:hypothetical protein